MSADAASAVGINRVKCLGRTNSPSERENTIKNASGKRKLLNTLVVNGKDEMDITKFSHFRILISCFLNRASRRDNSARGQVHS